MKQAKPGKIRSFAACRVRDDRNAMELKLGGYFPKRVAARPDWLDEAW